MTVVKRHYHRDDPADLSHFSTLLDMIGASSTANEAEQLQYCYQRVVQEGARSSSGLWCICLTEDAPATVDSRAHGEGDGKAALVAVAADLEHAADLLPISWSSTQTIYETQERGGLYRARYIAYRRNQHVSELDRWQEPRDPETRRPQSRQLAHFMMAVSLGSRVSCDLAEHRLRELKEAA